ERLKPVARPEKYVSPTIEALRQQLAGGKATTDAFWKERAAAGTPIVEPDKEPQRVLVTFVWRGTPSTRNVVVLGSFGARTFTDGAMTRLGESDVWYVTLRLPAGARFAYGLSPNDPMTMDPPRAARRMASMQSDPLNPNRWQCLPE